MEVLDGAELRLLQAHEEIVAERERLEVNSRDIAAAREADRRRRQVDSVHAERVADDARAVVDVLQRQIDVALDQDKDGDVKLKALQDNYWSMVKNVRPVWEEEKEDSENRTRKKSKN